VDSDGYEGLSGFRFALRRFLAASEAINQSAGVTQQQYQALLAIKTWPGQAMTMRDLADQLLLTHHAAVQLVDRLAKADLALRRPSMDDGRSVDLRLSVRGEAILDELAAHHLAEILRQEPLLTRSLARLRRMKPRLQQGPENG
jgi:DNA-binding MarR family transcriptional regulator